MKNILLKIFPETADNNYKGSKIAMWVFILLALVSTIRSFIHLLAPDGGANTIAGLDLSKGADNIIFSFGLWGLSQLIYAFFQLLAAFRYRSLIPLMYMILIFETAGRMFVGTIKPPVLFHTPPGGFANYIILPLAVIMLILSLREKKNKFL